MLKTLILGCSDVLEPPFKKGDIISGRYQIDCLLGTGSYGRSYLVNDSKEGRQAVLKFLRFHKRILKRGRESFMREAELLNALNHSAIPEIYSIGQHQGIPYFTMEHIQGKTFEQLIFNEGRIYRENEAFTIAMELLKIIGFIHSKKIVHRDIRIPNVMVQDGKLKLIDFGLARIMEGDTQPSSRQPGNLLKEIAFRSDFYGLGHFILFLLYSGFEAGGNQKEHSWEDELNLPPFSTFVIRRLLQVEDPYQEWEEIYEDFYKIVNIN